MVNVVLELLEWVDVYNSCGGASLVKRWRG